MTAVIYARYSSDNQREESIEGQIRAFPPTPKRTASLLSNTTLTAPTRPELQTGRSFSEW